MLSWLVIHFYCLRMSVFGCKVTIIITLVVPWIIILIVWYFFITSIRAIVNYLIDFAKFYGVCSTFRRARRAGFYFSQCRRCLWPDSRVSAFSLFSTYQFRIAGPILVDQIHVRFISFRHLLLDNFSLAFVSVTLSIIFTSGMFSLTPFLPVLASGASLIFLFDVFNVLIQEVVR